MAFQLTPLHIPSLTTDFSAQTNATARLGEMLGNLPGEFRKEQLQQQKQQILGQIGTGNLDYEKAGRSLIALGDTQAGATLLTLGQKQQEREAEKTWMGGGVANPAATPMALGSPNEVETRFLGGVQKAGLTNPNGLAAVAAYGKSESGYSPGNVNKTWSDPSESGAAGTSGGIMSWRADRLQNLQNFARQRGEQGNGSPETQAAFLASEDPTLVPRLNAARSPQEANQIMADAWRFAGYNRPGQGEFARREGLTGAYAQRYAGQPGAAPAQPVQVAENEADVRRLEQEQAARGSQPMQVAGAADLPPQGVNAAPVQGFAIPGEPAQQSILNDKNVQLWTQRHASAPTERTRAIAKQQLDLAVKDAEQRYAEGKTPEAVREFMWAKRNGMTDARSPAEYAREKEKPKGPMTVSEGQRLVDPETGRVIVDAQSGAKTSREIEERTSIADRQGLTGEAREAYILNGRVPVGAEKTTEGQANAALYADRMKEAEAIFAQPGMTEAGMSRVERGKSILPGGNSLVSSEFQRVDQAQRNFINAALRRESGAVISEQEFDNARKQYFPQPGDGKEVIAQKARNRQTAIQGISNAAGPSYAKRQKEAAPAQFREGQRASNGQQTIVFRNGQWVPE